MVRWVSFLKQEPTARGETPPRALQQGIQSCEWHWGGKISVEQSFGRGYLQDPSAWVLWGGRGDGEVSTSEHPGGWTRRQEALLNHLRGLAQALDIVIGGFGFYFFFFPMVGESFEMEEKRNYCSNVVRLS